MALQMHKNTKVKAVPLRVVFRSADKSIAGVTHAQVKPVDLTATSSSSDNDRSCEAFQERRAMSQLSCDKATSSS